MFHFQCPNGHLLEGDETQAGQQCQCPMCNILFIIPQPIGSANEPAGEDSSTRRPEEQAFPDLIGPPGNRSNAIGPENLAHDPMAPVSDGPAGGFSLGDKGTATVEPALYHIPCPNGHELEVPEEMLRQDVLCPFCEVQFHLRLKDSVEYKKQKLEEQEKKDRKAGKAWLHWAIAIAVVVVLALLALIIYSSSS